MASDPYPPRTTDLAHLPARIEWPTIAVALVIAAGLALTVLTHEQVPAIVTIAAFGVLGGWYSSLQHEVLHGHPTPWRLVNLAIAGLPLQLLLPYWLYRDHHLLHHQAELTAPGVDPESWYVSRSDWDRAGPARRLVLRANRTLLGRLIIGPPRTAMTIARELVVRSRHGEAPRVLRFLAGVAGVVAAVVALGVPLWQYVLGVSYLGVALILVRSFAEHRAVPSGSRTAVVQSRGFWALLFLNNNLHVTHHEYPGAAWYRLPQLHQELGADQLAAGGAGLYRGYRQIVRLYAVRPFCQVVDPLDRDSAIVTV